MVPSVTTLDKTAPGLELNSLEAIICIGTPFAQQMPEVNKFQAVSIFCLFSNPPDSCPDFDANGGS
jgi:hypothetical protein